MSAIFISHSSADNAIANELRDWLRAHGLGSLFLDFDPELGIPAGRHWEQELYRQLRACQAVIVLCSPNSMASDWCFVEITHGRALGKHIFPVRIAPCTLRPTLSELQVVDATASRLDAYERLLRGLRLVGLESAEFWDGSRPPYPGLAAFQESDAAVYFGRADDVRAGLDTLTRLRRFGETRLLACLGASGSGKSSLLRAGVLPRLKRDVDNWLCVAPFRPSKAPIDELAMALADVTAGSPARDWKAIAAELESAADADDPAPRLGALMRDLRQDAGRREAAVLVTIDQFEEAFVAGAPALRFLRLVRALALDPGGATIVIATLRSDFLAAWQNHPELQGVAYETFVVGPLAADGMVEVIEGPAQVTGLELDPGLTSMLLAETEAQDGLPLLAFALRELWEQDGRTGRLTIETYRKRLGGLQGCVARAAEEVLSRTPLEPGQEDDLRVAFLAMARLGESGQYLRRTVEWDDLPVRIHPLLQRFVDARLLVTRSDGDRRVVEVAHEALFRVWQRARAWLEADRENLRLREGLRQAAREWDERGRTAELLVHRGSRLEATEALATEVRLPLEPVQREYLEAAIGARTAEQDAVRRQAAARTRRVRATVAALALGLVVVSALGLWGRVERRQATSRLASLHWVSGINERDRNNDDLKAVHHFMQAAALSTDAVDVRNARLAASLLAGSMRLSAVMPSRETIGSAQFDGGQVRIWSDAGTAEVWDAESGRQLESAQSAGTASKIQGSPRGRWIVLRVGDAALDVLDGRSGRRVASSGRAAKDLPAFSDSEARFAVRDADGSVRVWDAAGPSAGKDDSIRSFAHPLHAAGAALSGDGARLLTWTDQGDVRVATADTAAVIAELRFPETVAGAALRVDGKRVLLWGKETAATLWDVERNVSLELVPRDAAASHANPATMGATFLADGKRVVTWNYGGIGSARLWDAETGAELGKFRHGAGAIAGARMDRDAGLMMTFGDDTDVRVWRLRDASLRFAMSHGGEVRGASFNADGTRIVTWSEDRTARVWDARSGQPLGLPMLHDGVVSGAQFGTDGKSVLTWDHRAARVWRADPTAEHRVLAMAGDAAVLAAALRSADGIVWTLTADGQLHRASGAREERAQLASVTDLVGAQIDGGRRRIVAWSTDEVGLWSLDSGQRLTPRMRHDASALGIYGVAVNADGSRLLSFGDDTTARLWDSASGQPIALLRHPGGVTGAVLAADNRGALTWGDDRVVRLWDVERGAALLTLPANKYGVQGAALTPDGAEVLVWDSNGTLRRWAAKDGKALGAVDLTAGKELGGVLLTRDAKRVMAWDSVGEVGLWDLARGESANVARWSAGPILGAAFNADESVVLTRGDEPLVRLWDGRHGYPLSAPFPLASGVLGAEFSSDERWLLAWSQKEVRVWDVGVDRDRLGTEPASGVALLQWRSGTRLDRLGELELITTKEWAALRDRIGPGAAK